MSEQQWRVDGAERWEWLTFDFEQGAVRVRCGDTFNQSGDDGRTLTREEVIALRDKLSEWIGDGDVDDDPRDVIPLPTFAEDLS